MKLLPVPFNAGMDQSTDAAFMAPGGLTLVENLRPTRAGRLSKRPPTTHKHDGGATYRPIQFVSSAGRANLIAAESELFVSSGSDVDSIGSLPCGTPLWMRDHQHTGETSDDLPEVEVRRVSSALMGAETVVAYEFQTGSGFGERTRIMARVIDRATGRVRAETSSGSLAQEKPMLVDVPGQGLRMFYTHRSGELPGDGVFCKPVEASGTDALGSALAGVVNDDETVDVFSVGVHASVTSHYFVATSSSGGLGLRLFRVNAADNTELDDVLVTAGTDSVARVDVCVSPTRVWVVWKSGNEVRVRVYSHDLSTFVSPNNQLNTVDETSPGQPFVSYRADEDRAYAMWSSDNAAVSTRGESCASCVVIEDDGSSFVLTRELQLLRPLSRLLFLSHATGASTTSVRMFFAGSEPALLAPNPPRVFEFVSYGGVWRALSVLALAGEADPGATTEHPSTLNVVAGNRVSWMQRVRLQTNMYAAREWEMELGSAPQRRPLPLGDALLVPGGELVAFSGARTHEAGFLTTPRVFGAASSGQASVNMPAGVYTYAVVYESLDASGRLRVSPPSLPLSFTAAGGTSTDLELPPPPLNKHRGAFVANIYRTTADGTVLYKLTSLRGGYTGLTYRDNTSDANLSQRAILYTEGGVLPYDPAPASTFGVVALGRVWLGGLFERSRIVCSVDVVPGEMPGFPLDATHWIDFPDEVTGLAALHGELVVFTRSAIWVVSGDGPTRTGAGGFPPPRRMETDLGCVDWRSVVSTTLGVFYQSRAGILLLPGGGAPPMYIGQAVADEFTDRPYVVDASVHGEGDSAVARFVLAESQTPAEPAASSRVLTFSLRARAWSADTYAATDRVYHVGNWLDTNGQEMAVLGARNLQDGVLVEEATAAEYPPSRIITGEVAPFGFGSEFRVSRLWLRLTNRGAACTVTVRIVYDDQLPTDPNLDFIELGVPGGGVFGQPVRLEWRPRQAQCKNVRFLIEDSQNGPASSRGVDYLGLVLEVDPVGAQHLATSNRR